MSTRLPPLNALRTFEAAARHLSFTRAADELNVTQAAVSHQVKTLEEHLGMRLFRRLNRALKLTEQGRALYPAVGEALGILGAAVERLHQRDRAGVLTVTVMDSFASTWLVPRLGRFRKDHPDINVHLLTSDVSIDLTRENVDLAIRYGEGEWPGLHAEHLMTEDLFPVCAPSLLMDGPPLETPSDLKHYTLLHDTISVDWRVWLLAAGVDDVDPERGVGFLHSNLVIQAAVQGDGVALARSVLVADELAAGRLVKPFDLALPAKFAHYVVTLEQNLDRPKVKAFRQWLFDQVALGPGVVQPPRPRLKP